MLEVNADCERLGPALLGVGFAAGQVGHGQDSYQVTFCAALDELSERLPGLPKVTTRGRSTGACVD